MLPEDTSPPFTGFQSRHTGYGSDAVFRVADTIANKMSAQDIAIADHEGQLKSLSGLVAAVQSSMAAIQSSLGAWQNTAIGVAGAIGVALALLGALQLYFGGQIGSTNDKIDDLKYRITGIEQSQKTLPAEISKEILSTAATLSTIRQFDQRPQPRPIP